MTMLQLCDHDEPCGCYVAGKDKAHFDIRNALLGGHAVDCGCESCKSIRISVETPPSQLQTPCAERVYP